MSDRVLRELEDGVLLLVLNRPEKKNAFDDALWDALRAALDEAREDDDVAVVVVTGAGGDFSAGADLSQWRDASAEREDGRANGYWSAMDALFRFDKPLLAAAKGVGVGIGCTFLFACDVVYVGESVRLRMPFVSLGVVPEAASSFMLQWNLGGQRAAELLLTAEWIDARRAVECGIAVRAYPDDVLLEAALGKARQIAQFPVTALRATKQTLMVTREAGIRAAREAEDRLMAQQAGSPENLEAVKAFVERRPADFRQFRPSARAAAVEDEA